MKLDLRAHAPQVPLELADALAVTYADTVAHSLTEEWDDMQVDAGRFSEAVLRYLEWRMHGTHTPIDGKRKPNRAKVVGAAKNETSLPPTLRAQVPQALELVLDFRNNRNSAHLGDIDPNRMDGACVLRLASWVIGEVIRLETQKSTGEVQTLLDRLSQRRVPLIQRIGDCQRSPKFPTLDQRNSPPAETAARSWPSFSRCPRIR